MNFENKLEVLDRVLGTVITKPGYSELPWLILCAAQTYRDWDRAVKQLKIDARNPISYHQVYLLELWLDKNPEPHLIIVDEYDPGLRTILQPLLVRLNDQGHKLFMTRLEPK